MLSNTLEPSKGGIGIILNIPSITFTTTTRNKTPEKSADTNPERMTIANIAAMKKLESGPANATIASEKRRKRPSARRL